MDAGKARGLARLEHRLDWDTDNEPRVTYVLVAKDEGKGHTRCPILYGLGVRSPEQILYGHLPTETAQNGA